MLTGLLPLAAAVLLVAGAKCRQPQRGWLDAILTASLGTASFTVVSTELLSLLDAVRFGPLAALWLLATLGLGFALHRTGRAPALIADVQRRLVSGVRSPWAVGVAALAATTLMIALAASPNTWDSMTYHMARIAHWGQQGSVAHYPTNIPRQLHYGPGAEMLILHLQTLAQSDRFANCVQWAAYGLAAVAAMLTARELGASRAGERFAAIFVLTVPMLVLQSTSTQNDLVTAAWIAMFALYGLRWSRGGGLDELWRAAAALGLAVLTKGTTLLFAGPFVLWFALSTIHRRRPRIWAAAAMVIGIVIGINAGHFARNLQVFGHPLGSGTEGPEALASEVRSPATLVSGVTRNLALQLAAPSDSWNRGVVSAVRRLHTALALSPQDPRTTWHGLRFDLVAGQHEDTAGAPLHTLLAVMGLATALCMGRFRPPGPAWALFCLGTIIGAALFAFLLRWQPWHTRLHVPLWVLAAPCLAVVAARVPWRPTRAVLSVALAVWAVPTLLYGRPRPLVGDANVLTTPRSVQYFANRPHLQMEYEEIADRVGRIGAVAAALRLGADDWEYPLWVLLGPGVHLRHDDVRNSSASLATAPRSEPSVIICTDAEARVALDDDPAWQRTVSGESSALYERRTGPAAASRRRAGTAE